jgi:hypothetical protein
MNPDQKRGVDTKPGVCAVFLYLCIHYRIFPHGSRDNPFFRTAKMV